MSHLPSWLSPSTAQVAEVVTKDVESPVITTTPKEMNAVFTAEERADLAKVHWILRITYMVIAANLGGCSAYAIQLANVSTSVGSTACTECWSTVFIALYVFVFGIIICCFEIGLTVITKAMSENFGFLYTIAGRTLFMAMIAGMCVKLYIYGDCMIAMIAIALLIHYALLFRNPRLGEYIRQLHYYAGK